MGVLSWALDRFANATADPTIPAQDGASARSFMDLLRGVMAGSRAFADDQGGAIVTAGAANAYTVRTASGVTQLRPGLSLFVQIDRTNTAEATLNVDGTGPKPWRDGDGGEFVSSYLPERRFLRVTWDASRGCWISDVISLLSFEAAFRSWMMGLPTAPDGLGAGRPWKQGDATSGYTLNLTGTNT